MSALELLRKRGLSHTAPPVERFWAYVDDAAVRGDDCWVWKASTSNGYGSLSVDGKRVPAHRFAYELMIGPIPEGLEIDHLCRNRSCVNPSHLEPVTREENIRRGESPPANNARKTHCKYGHELTPENTYTRGENGRECRECWTIRSIGSSARRRARFEQTVAGKPIPHGTRTGYNVYRCRCAECREAHRLYFVGYNARKRARAALAPAPAEETTA